MHLLTTRAALTGWRQSCSPSQSVGFVPTMGNLHDGHLRLVEQAKQQCDIVVVSIFVNPLQFGANEDLARYPRTFEDDCQKLTAAGVDALFFPAVEDIYPRGMRAQTFVEVPGVSEVFCGASRPGHFRGVATVVCKLFHMVKPDYAFFGEKDFQQLLVIKTMVADLAMDIHIVPVATQRELSGLAMSSRNGYLSVTEKEQASHLYQCLQECKSRILAGNNNYTELATEYHRQLGDLGFTPDYFAICNGVNLAPATATDKELVILVAATLGNTRLIDNIHFVIA